MALLPIKIPPGFFKNNTQYQAKNRWFDGNLVRFSEGRLRPIGGWQRLTPTKVVKGGKIASVEIKDGGAGYSAGTLTATGGGGQNFAASFTVHTVGGVAGIINAVSISNRGSGYTSDPTLVFNNAGNGKAILEIKSYSGADPIRGMHSWRLSAGSRYLIVASVQKIYVWDSDETAGVNSPMYNITPTSVPSGIKFDEQEDFQIAGLGYGALKYGEGEYGVPRYPPADPNVLDINAFRTNFTPTVSIQNFGDDAIICHSGQGNLWHWDVSGVTFNNANQTATAPTVLTNAPNSCVSVIVTNENYIMALGSGGNYRKIQWCSESSLTDWSPTSTNSAGSIEVQAKGRIVGGFKSRYGVLLFFTDSVWLAKFVGLPYVYTVERLSEGGGALGEKAVSGSADYIAWISQGRFWSYTGGFIQELQCDVADYVFSNINTDCIGLINAFHNSEFAEITWHYAVEGGEKCTRYVTYNYREKHWVTGNLERSAAESADSLGFPVLAGTDSYIYRHEMDPDTQSTPIIRAENVTAPSDVTSLSGLESRVISKGVSLTTHPDVATENHDLCYAETGAIEIPQAGDKFMSVSSILTDTDSGTNGLRMEITAQTSPDDTSPTVKGPYQLNNDGITDTRILGRQLFFKVQSPFDQDWRAGEFRLEATPQGER